MGLVVERLMRPGITFSSCNLLLEQPDTIAGGREHLPPSRGGQAVMLSQGAVAVPRRVRTDQRGARHPQWFRRASRIAAESLGTVCGNNGLRIAVNPRRHAPSADN